MRQPLKAGQHFDGVADAYHSTRIRYPAALFHDMFEYAGDPMHRALEIGCGTGQATDEVASRGVSLTCIEPGPNLAALARQKFAKAGNVRVICSSFESWPVEAQAYDLVFSANAIHWVARRKRVRKTAQALRSGGTVAIFRTIPLASNSALETRIDAAMGGVAATTKEPESLPKESDFRDSKLFTNFLKYRYYGSHTYDADSYAAFLSTLQRYQRIPVEIRNQRINNVRALIQEHGGTISVNYVTQLLLARKATGLRWWKKFSR